MPNIFNKKITNHLKHIKKNINDIFSKFTQLNDIYTHTLKSSTEVKNEIQINHKIINELIIQTNNDHKDIKNILLKSTHSSFVYFILGIILTIIIGTIPLNNLYDKVIEKNRKADELISITSEISNLSAEGQFEYNNQNYINSKKLNEEILKIDPNNLGAIESLAIIETTLGNYSNAIFYYDLLINKSPNQRFYYNKGLSYANLKEYEEAIFYINKSIDINDSYALAWSELGGNYYEIHDYANAYFALKKALDLGINNYVTWYNYGLTVMNLDIPNKENISINAYRNAIKLNPYHYNAVINLGILYTKQKRYNDTLQLFENYLCCIKDSPGFYALLGESYFFNEQYEDAIEMLNISFEMGFHDLAYMIYYAHSYYYLNKTNEAINAYEKIIMDYPLNNIAYNQLEYLYLRTGNLKRISELQLIADNLNVSISKNIEIINSTFN